MSSLLRPPSTQAEAGKMLEADFAEGIGPVTFTVAKSEGPPASIVLKAQSRGGVLWREALPLAILPRQARIEALSLAAGKRVALLRFAAGNARLALLVVPRAGKLEIAWSGRLDFRGESGGRQADFVDTADRNGDGLADIVIGKRFERIALCGEEATPVELRALDPASMQLRPVEAKRVRAAGQVLEAKAELRSGKSEKPRLNALRFRGASSMAGEKIEVAALSPPLELSDGNLDSVWAEGRGGRGRWEFLSAQWESQAWPLRALGIVASPRNAAFAARLARARSLWVVGKKGALVHVRFPQDPLQHPGQTYWVDLPSAQDWSCISIVLDEVYAPSSLPEGEWRTAIAEIRGYSELDLGNADALLVGALATSGPRAEEASRILSEQAALPLAMMQAEWPRWESAARQRALGVLAAHAKTQAPVRAWLAKLARDEEASLAADAFRVLLKVGPEASEELAAFAAGNDAYARAALVAWARFQPEKAWPRLLTVFAEHPDHRGLRRALRQGLVQRPSDPALLSWMREQGPTPASTELLILAEGSQSFAALCEVGRTAPFLAQESFVERWRLLQVLGRCPRSTELEAWLMGRARDEKRWMLRAAAWRALVENKDEAAKREAMLEALRDPHPRVRLSAAEALKASPQTAAALEQRAQRDLWPMVRRQALLSRGDAALARRSLRDDASSVRAAALQVLVQRRDRGAWSLVKARLADGDEWPEVLSQAIDYARVLCVAESRPLLQTLVQRGFRANAWAPDGDVAFEALLALWELGGPEAEALRARFRSADAPALLKRLATKAPSRRCEAATSRR